MKENRTVAKIFAGLLVAGVIAVGGMGQTTAQAKDTGWNGTVAPSDTVIQGFRYHGISTRSVARTGSE